MVKQACKNNILDLDSPEAMQNHAQMIQSKYILNKIYQAHYQFFKDNLSSSNGDILELGSGGGFIKDFIPQATTSDMVKIQGIDAVVDATSLPYQEGSLSNILMINAVSYTHLTLPTICSV